MSDLEAEILDELSQLTFGKHAGRIGLPCRGPIDVLSASLEASGFSHTLPIASGEGVDEEG